MMFNLPLPGGTTGHAVGMGIAAIVVGPWASILAISIAVIIQALLFGDGGIHHDRRELFQHTAILGLAVGVWDLSFARSGRAPIGIAAPRDGLALSQDMLRSI